MANQKQKFASEISEPVSIFDNLQTTDYEDHIEEKGDYKYLSWAWAWTYVKQKYPDANFIKHTFENELPYIKDDEGYAFVKVTVTIQELSHTEIFAVMNNVNKPIKNPTSTQINVSLQRALVKALAYHGLGLPLYGGEDLPEEVAKAKTKEKKEQTKKEEDKEYLKLSEDIKTKYDCALDDLTKIETKKHLEQYMTSVENFYTTLKKHYPALAEKLVNEFKQVEDKVNNQKEKAA